MSSVESPGVIFPQGGENDDTVRVKICGLTSLEQAEAVGALGADAIGLNFWPGSKRYLAPAEAQWLSNLEGKTLRIGVFVNADETDIVSIFERNLIDWAQLHGDESPSFLNSIRSSGWPAFKALRVRDRDSLKDVSNYPGPLLLDAYAATDYGGTGQVMDWSLGAEVVRNKPDREIILAGGLTPGNVADAIRQVRPCAVDTASGVETSPGTKDLDLCEAFIRQAKGEL